MHGDRAVAPLLLPQSAVLSPLSASARPDKPKKSTGVHARVLAPDDVRLVRYPFDAASVRPHRCMANVGVVDGSSFAPSADDTLVVFPSAEATTPRELAEVRADVGETPRHSMQGALQALDSRARRLRL